MEEVKYVPELQTSKGSKGFKTLTVTFPMVYLFPESVFPTQTQYRHMWSA